MPALNRAKSTWDILRTVSVGAILQEAQTPVTLAVVGPEDRRTQALRDLYAGDAASVVHPELRVFESTSELAGFPREPGSFDIVIDAGGGRVDPPPGAAIYGIQDIGDWLRTAQRILDQRPDLALALARRFPGFRPEVSRRIVRDTALANAEFAMANALPGVFPALALLLPTASVGDMLMLAKNQALMLFRLAAAHGHSLELRDRARDLGPLLGNAFGWRAVAREVVGVVPGGVGLIARGVIAYAGTVALGEALLRLYAMGQKPSRAQINRYYREALADAREAVGGVARRLRGGGRRSLPRK
jgi:uncharacterized protein (DUF697 family)